MLIKRNSTIAVVVLLMAAAADAGQTESKRQVPDEYTATTANLSQGSGAKLSIQVLKWSSKEDRERVIQAIRSASKEEKPQEDLVKQTGVVSTAGYIWSDGPVGYSVKYAHRAAQPGGGEHIVLVTDRPLGMWGQPGPWKVAGREASLSPFTIVELRVNKNGKGEGKMSLGTSFSVNDAEQTLSLSDYDGAVVTLRNVERQPKPYWASGL